MNVDYKLHLTRFNTGSPGALREMHTPIALPCVPVQDLRQRFGFAATICGNDLRQCLLHSICVSLKRRPTEEKWRNSKRLKCKSKPMRRNWAAASAIWS